MNNTVGDERRSCFAERKAFERTKRRLETAERKMRVVRQWQYQLRQEMDKLQSQIAKLDFMLDDDVAKGLAVLERMTSALDDYAGSSSNRAAAPSTQPTQSEHGEAGT